jgi:transcriptional regulator with XRE-family HTH domain
MTRPPPPPIPALVVDSGIGTTRIDSTRIDTAEPKTAEPKTAGVTIGEFITAEITTDEAKIAEIAIVEAHLSKDSETRRVIPKKASVDSARVDKVAPRLGFMNRPWPESMSLGEMIRRQREMASLPMRQLAAMAGISNPYLSQIERGLRDPSDHVLNAIADSLQMSADSLRPPVQDPGPDAAPPAVVAAVRADPDLTAQQRKALEESYLAFREVTIERRRVKGRRNGGASSDASPANAD